ncbi:hypothetical protein DWQ65_08020 [Treponema phagedenis]|uniref:Transposase n=1 Tax=Treponema phagedenis TaxID=162 RepID=A0A0B7GXZ6_TREPH|nr:transposase [Treponema phagedenis]QSH98759.1 hypothetical protein DWQ65_01455 [Treponema phagedenis]QSH99356.1 hypothetical protein DWQ65_04620 [Treponema phagedenis]QSH99590.1 hypothetical protein DWQ65_05850 [Treponema phagedenis]QSI00009.1 hypothetical protein DWQ65_08020 [Treponema phagedenis]CEM61486.1 hypothetical protein TPHV1_20023 [Treponema phagedenis]
MRRYSQEFKQQALQLSDEIGTKEAAKNLGISYGTLTDWRKRKIAIKQATELQRQKLSFWMSERDSSNAKSKSSKKPTKSCKAHSLFS